MEPSPWSTIWRNPRETIQRIVDENPRYQMLMLIVLGGIAQALDNANGVTVMLPSMKTSNLIVSSILMGPLGGLFTVYVGGWVLQKITTRMGGPAPLGHVRTVMAWAWAPLVYTMPLWGIKYILFRDELFQVEQPIIQSSTLLQGLWGIIQLVDVIVIVFHLYILFSGLAQINKFTFLKSVGAFLILQVILSIPLLLLFSLMMSAGLTI